MTDKLTKEIARRLDAAVKRGQGREVYGAEALRQAAAADAGKQEKTDTDRQRQYLAYLKSPEWQVVRRWALHRAGWKCQVCSETTQLEVHHNTYERLGHEAPTDVVALCDHCHKLFGTNSHLDDRKLVTR